jgi:hypothetical protein
MATVAYTLGGGQAIGGTVAHLLAAASWWEEAGSEERQMRV